MARSLRDIRRKMKAIKSTSQVTKAMELVAASKMRKAVQNAQMLRHYALSAWRILQSIAKTKGQANHSFLEQRPVKNVLGIIFTSDRGLCGSLNAQLFRTTSQYLKGLKDIKGFENIDFITVGKKGHQFLTRQGQTVIATFEQSSLQRYFAYHKACDRFIQGRYLQPRRSHLHELHFSACAGGISKSTATFL